jgi:uncharacterized metal-binding protein YceD (DUF177 family)
MNNRIPLRKPGAEVGDRHKVHVEFEADPLDLYGRHHYVTHAEADVAVTKVSEGLHLDLRVSTVLSTTCDRTLDPVELRLEFRDSELLAGPDDEELAVDDWTLDLTRYAGRTLPNEIPMQVFKEGTEPVRPPDEGDEVDPRWRGLDDISVSGF